MFDSGIIASELITELQGEVDVALPISNEAYIAWLNGLEQLLYSEFIREQHSLEFELSRSGRIPIEMLLDEETIIEVTDTYRLKITLVLSGNHTALSDFTKSNYDFFGLDEEPLVSFKFYNEKKWNYLFGNPVEELREVYIDSVSYDGASTKVKLYGDFPFSTDINAFHMYLVGATFRVNGYSKLSFLNELTYPDGQSSARFEDIHVVYADDVQLTKSTLTSGVIFPESYYKKKDDINFNLSKHYEKIKIIYFARPILKTTDNYNTLNVKVPTEFIDLMKSKLRGEAYKLANEDSLAAKWINDYNVLLENFKAWVSSRQAQFGM